MHTSKQSCPGVAAGGPEVGRVERDEDLKKQNTVSYCKSYRRPVALGGAVNELGALKKGVCI
eukprot:2358896-Pyramimonas_sp.AAC.3